MNVQILGRDVVGFFSFRKVNLLFPTHWQDMTVLLVNILKILWRFPFMLRWGVYRNVYCGNSDCGNDLCVKFYKGGKFQIIVNNKLDALFHYLFINFISLYVSGIKCSSSGVWIVLIHQLVWLVCVSDCLLCRSLPAYQAVTYTD